MKLKCEVTKTLDTVRLNRIIFMIPHNQMVLVYDGKDKAKKIIDLTGCTTLEKAKLKEWLWWALKKDSEITEIKNPFIFEKPVEKIPEEVTK